MEKQCYGGKGRDVICALCCSDEDFLTPEEIKNEKNMQDKDPLRLCGVCVGLKIQPPIKKGRTTNFDEKGRQEGTAKARKRTEYEGRGIREQQKKTHRGRERVINSLVLVIWGMVN